MLRGVTCSCAILCLYSSSCGSCSSYNKVELVILMNCDHRGTFSCSREHGLLQKSAFLYCLHLEHRPRLLPARYLPTTDATKATTLIPQPAGGNNASAAEIKEINFESRRSLAHSSVQRAQPPPPSSAQATGRCCAPPRRTPPRQGVA